MFGQFWEHRDQNFEFKPKFYSKEDDREEVGEGVSDDDSITKTDSRTLGIIVVGVDCCQEEDAEIHHESKSFKEDKLNQVDLFLDRSCDKDK